MPVSESRFLLGGFALPGWAASGFRIPRRCCLIADGFHIDSFQFVALIDGFAILINWPPFHYGSPWNRVPLTAAAVLKDMMVASGGLVHSSVIEGSTGAVFMSYLQDTVFGSGTVNRNDWALIPRHKLSK